MPLPVDRSGVAPVVLRALLYAVLVTALALFAGGDPRVFIYMGF